MSSSSSSSAELMQPPDNNNNNLNNNNNSTARKRSTFSNPRERDTIESGDNAASSSSSSSFSFSRSTTGLSSYWSRFLWFILLVTLIALILFYARFYNPKELNPDGRDGVKSASKPTFLIVAPTVFHTGSSVNHLSINLLDVVTPSSNAANIGTTGRKLHAIGDETKNKEQEEKQEQKQKQKVKAANEEKPFMAIKLRAQDGNIVAHREITKRPQMSRFSLPFFVPFLSQFFRTGNSRAPMNLEVEIFGQKHSATVQVEPTKPLVFVETDKPIYKPSQKILVHLYSLHSNLKPFQQNGITVSIQDAKGIKVSQSVVDTDEFGMATTELQLSNEPNFGVWKISAEMPPEMGVPPVQRDVRVEKYVLPKYKVDVQFDRSWALADEKPAGKIVSRYVFGKPVVGTAKIEAWRYVGTWERYAEIVRELTLEDNGEMRFELPPVNYAVGSLIESGKAGVRIDVVVEEKATGYRENTTASISVASSPVVLQLICDSTYFKPGLPFSCLVLGKNPGGELLDGVAVDATIGYQPDYGGYRHAKKPGADHINTRTASRRVENPLETRKLTLQRGKAWIRIDKTDTDASKLIITVSSNAASVQERMPALYSPSSSFIHVEQQETTSGKPLKVGDVAKFKVYTSKDNAAQSLFYEVVSKNNVQFSGVDVAGSGGVISFTVTPQMSPSAKLLVYQIIPSTSEITSDYVSFKVDANYPLDIQTSFLPAERESYRPGEQIKIALKSSPSRFSEFQNALQSSETPVKYSVLAVDESVYVLAENRLNLRQVFDDLERMYSAPKFEVERSPRRVFWSPFASTGSKQLFSEAGLTVISNSLELSEPPQPPAEQFMRKGGFGDGMVAMNMAMAPAREMGAPPMNDLEADTLATGAAGDDLQEVSHVRSFFPETWFWQDIESDGFGSASMALTVPDSITTWAVRTIGISKDHGFGIGESKMLTFTPFFLTVDLPYSAIRSEEFPVNIALYNYVDSPQTFTVELEATKPGQFDLLEPTNRKQVVVGATEVGSCRFMIRPTTLGTIGLKVSARSKTNSDAVVKEMIIEPEGLPREKVDNFILRGTTQPTPVSLDFTPTQTSSSLVAGSERAFVSVTGNVMSSVMDGLDHLLAMPFGCGEQNMVTLAPDVFVLKYLKATNQMRPEIVAKAQMFLTTGYQRELTYMHKDGSFSAFGETDPSGNTWLTAFVLKTFSQARDLRQVFIDESVLQSAASWLSSNQNKDGSFKNVGNLIHREMSGGANAENTLNAYVTIALMTYVGGDVAGSLLSTPINNAIAHLEKQVDSINDDYTLALVSYALAMAKSSKAQATIKKALPRDLRDVDADTKTTTTTTTSPHRTGQSASSSIETTAYMILALLRIDDTENAGRAARWLINQRNPNGGFSSTQDTVVALEALSEVSTRLSNSVDTKFVLEELGDDGHTTHTLGEVKITPGNADVLRIIEIPASVLHSGKKLVRRTDGKGEVLIQVVRRFSELPPPASEGTGQQEKDFDLDVEYDTEQVAVNDLITITVKAKFNERHLANIIPRTAPEIHFPMQTGMAVIDVAVPTGFSILPETRERLLEAFKHKMKRVDIAGRKLVVYLDNMARGEQIEFYLQARALFPVRAKPVVSKVYAYYDTKMSQTALAGAVHVA